MKRIMLAAIAAMLASAVVLTSHGAPASAENKPGNSNKESPSKVDTAAEKLKKEREEFVRKAEDELGDLNRRIVELRRMARKKTGEARITLNQEIQLLEAEQKATEKKLAKLKVEIGEKWDTLKSDISAAIEQLKKSVEKTRNDMFEGKKDTSQ